MQVSIPDEAIEHNKKVAFKYMEYQLKIIINKGRIKCVKRMKT